LKPDLLAGATTFLLAAIKLFMLSLEGSIPGIFYFFIAIWSSIFWANMLPIADLITGKEYIRFWHVYGTKYGSRISRKKRPNEYYFRLAIAVLFAAFSSAMMFNLKPL
jgi:hypothetical protein